MVTIACTAEGQDETRIAVSPETIKKFVGMGCKVRVQSGAGERSHFSDEVLKDAGAEIVDGASKTIDGADILVKVKRPSADELKALGSGGLAAAIMDPFDRRENLEELAATNAKLFAMELMPRITRAQSMDVLSSQANLAGYKAVVDAASEFHRAMPQMMTAAGTVPAAKAFIMGAGVAGLQAIATAKRLGAVVTATDVRPDAKEQVASLGAKFIAVENEEFEQAQTEGGYAKEMSDDYKKQQAELVAEHIKKQDLVVTTALIPGRPAPELIDEKMVKSMKSGAIIVDLAAERGGNCAMTKPGETYTTDNGVTIIGRINLAGEVPVNASALYAKNIQSFLGSFIEQDKEKEETRLEIDWDDEVIKGTLVAKDGKIVHEKLTGESGDTKKEEPANTDGDEADSEDDGSDGES